MMRKHWFATTSIAVLVGFSLLFVSNGMSDGHLLYERIGGHAGVTTVIDYFLTNVGGDDRVNGRFANTDMGRLRANLIDQVCEATGGPCTYTGKTMLEAHKGLGITEAEFGIIAEHFAAAMTKAGVGAQDHETIMGVLAGMQDDIVGH